LSQNLLATGKCHCGRLNTQKSGYILYSFRQHLPRCKQDAFSITKEEAAAKKNRTHSLRPTRKHQYLWTPQIVYTIISFYAFRAREIYNLSP